MHICAVYLIKECMIWLNHWNETLINKACHCVYATVIFPVSLIFFYLSSDSIMRWAKRWHWNMVTTICDMTIVVAANPPRCRLVNFIIKTQQIIHLYNRVLITVSRGFIHIKCVIVADHSQLSCNKCKQMALWCKSYLPCKVTFFTKLNKYYFWSY